MNTNIFSSGSSVLSNDALASSWKEVQEKHFSGSARSSFRIRENYEIIPDESLPMAALYWKRKYLDLSVQDEERQTPIFSGPTKMRWTSVIRKEPRRVNFSSVTPMP